MTLEELKALASSKGIKITKKGYKMNGFYYHVENWDYILAQIGTYDPLVNQVIRWLKATRT